MQFDFNVAQTPPASGASICFPLADYPVEIVKGECLPVNNKPQAGKCVYTLKVLAGPYQGQSQRYQLNLWSDSPQAKQIAQSELSALAIVVGRPTATDTDHLLGGQLIATIGPQDDNPKYSEVKAVKDIHGRTPAEILSGAAPSAAQVQQTQQQPVQQQPVQAGYGPTPGQQPTQPFNPGALAGTLPFGNQPAQPAQTFQGPHGPASFPANGGGFAGAAPAQPATSSPFGNAQPAQPTAPWQNGK